MKQTAPSSPLTLSAATAAPGCGRVRCSPNWGSRPHPQDFDLWLPVNGRGAMLLNGQPCTIAPGTLFVLRPGDSAQAAQDPAERLTVVYVHTAVCL